MDKSKTFTIAVATSIISLMGDWLLVMPMEHWWKELGVQLPGLTISWLGTTWHLIAALVVIGAALLMRIDGFQRNGFRVWLLVYVGWLVLTVLVLIMPMMKAGSLHEVVRTD